MRIHQLLLGLLVGTLSSTQAGATDKLLTLSSPVSGGRWGNQSPVSHPKSAAGTQYAVDIYGSVGSAVRWATGPDAAFPWNEWWGMVADKGTISGCSQPAGDWVLIYIYTSSSTSQAPVGAMFYSHLENVQVSKWQKFRWDARPVLGYLKQWDYSNCYQVTSSSAVHVHMEWGGMSGFGSSSSTSYSSGQSISGYVGFIKN